MVAATPASLIIYYDCPFDQQQFGGTVILVGNLSQSRCLGYFSTNKSLALDLVKVVKVEGLTLKRDFSVSIAKKG